MKKEVINFKENGEGHMEVVEGGDKREKSWAYNIISKKCKDSL